MLETRIVHASGVVAVPLVVSITVEMAKSFTLGMVKAILSGKGKGHRPRPNESPAPLGNSRGRCAPSAVAPSAALRQLTGEPLVEKPNDIVRIVTLSKCTPRGFL